MRGSLTESATYYAASGTETFPAGTPLEVITAGDVAGMDWRERAEARGLRARAQKAEARELLPDPPQYLARLGGRLRRVPKHMVRIG